MLDTPYPQRLRAAGIEPEEVDVVFCTHLHVDHVGWNTRLADGRWVPTFPNARYLFSRGDFEHFDRAMSLPGTSQMTRNTFTDSVLPIVEAGQAVYVDDGEEIAKGLSLEAAPGHTPGQMCLNLRSGGRLACFCGDVLHHPLQVPLWHWRTRICTDPDQSRDSRRRMLEQCEQTGALLLPAHFIAPHGGYIEHRNDSFGILWPEAPGGTDPRHARR